MYKIALIGYGQWGKTLLPYLERFFDVKAVFGRSIEKKGRFTNNLNDIFSSDIDAAVIATPMGTHYRITSNALKHNKHVFCEKPLAIEPSLAEELDFIAAEKKLHLITNYIYTFSKKLKEIQSDIICGNKIGKLRKMILTLKRKSKNDGVDIYWNLASHMLAVLDMFADIGNLEFDKTDLARQERGIVSFMGDIKGQILVDANSSNKETEVIFSGDTGKMICNNLHKEEEGLIHAMKYFKDVLDGSIDNKPNIATAVSVTDVLWGLEFGGMGKR